MGRSEREERQRRKQERMERDRDGSTRFSGSYCLGKHGFEFDFLKVEEGPLRLHVLPYLIKGERHPEVSAGRMEIGDEDYFLEYGVHRGIGPNGQSSVLCLDMTFSKPCPICEHARELKKEGEKDDVPWPSRRVIYNVMVDGEKEIRIFDVSEKLFHRELKSKLSRTERGFFDYSDLEEGALVVCYAEETKRGRFTFFEFKDFEFVDRKPFPRTLLDKTYPLEKLLNVPTYDQVQSFYQGEETSIDYREAEDEQTERSGKRDRSGDDAAAGEEHEGLGKRSRAEAGDQAGEDEKPRGAREAAKKETKDLSYGDECPYGLKYGEDHDTDKRKCGIECPDKLFNACGKEREAHEEKKSGGKGDS